MTLKDTMNKLNTIKCGRITKIHYVTIKGDYTKETETCVRFVDYAHIKGVTPKGKPNANDNHIIKNMLIFNKNTHQYYLQCATINGNHKAHVKYFYQGKEIDKATYESANPSKPFNSPVFRKNINDIVSIG